MYVFVSPVTKVGVVVSVYIFFVYDNYRLRKNSPFPGTPILNLPDIPVSSFKEDKVLSIVER